VLLVVANTPQFD